MTLREAIAWLDGHVNLEATAGKVHGLSLERMRSLAAVLGDPQRDFPSVHITGTNGKGSAAHLIGRLFAAQGLHAGTYASPHVSSINERISLAGAPVGDETLADLLSDVRRAVEAAGIDASWFEIMTGAALRCFADAAVDVAVVEVGKLGRYDATNVVDGQVAVVTNVGEDHTDGGPGWRAAVAWEKAGIVKPGATLVLGETDPALREVFGEAGPSRTLLREEDFACCRNDLAVGGRLLDIAAAGRYEDVFLELHGRHQGDNAALALAACEAFFDAPLAPESVSEAFAGAGLPGRLEILRRAPLVVVDGAHNPDGASAARLALDEDFAGAARTFMVLGMMRERDPRRIFDEFGAGGCELLVTTTAPSPRGIPAVELARLAREAGIRCEAVEDPAAAVAHATALASPEDLVFVSGSLYVAGAARVAETAPPAAASSR
ncbi:MAG: Mur ligase family protein [bacterium]|nr:Mur ligase family protein [bacterium]MDE0668241.1 Mur ligase family protein [bacterium]